MAVIYLRIEGDGCSDIHKPEERDLKIQKLEIPSRCKIKYNINGIFLHFLLQELIFCDHYRRRFIKYHVPNFYSINRILFNLQNTNDQIIDYKWNERISYLVREKCELEHALSWLSTLGGAFSALGDYFSNFALVAGKISYHQLMLAIRMGDPNIASRCKLYFSLSLIQRHKFRLARKVIQVEYGNARSAVIVDTRLVKMCLGIWSKLQYEYQVYRESKKCKRLCIK